MWSQVRSTNKGPFLFPFHLINQKRNIKEKREQINNIKKEQETKKGEYEGDNKSLKIEKRKQAEQSNQYGVAPDKDRQVL